MPEPDRSRGLGLKTAMKSRSLGDLGYVEELVFEEVDIGPATYAEDKFGISGGLRAYSTVSTWYG